MAIHLLDKPYVVIDPPVSAWCVVVHGSDNGVACSPACPNAGGILGVTIFSQDVEYAPVTVRKSGIARVRAAGPIQRGDPVNIAAASGKVKTVNEPPGTLVHCLGFAETSAKADEDVIEVFISIHDRLATEEG